MTEDSETSHRADRRAHNIVSFIANDLLTIQLYRINISYTSYAPLRNLTF